MRTPEVENPCLFLTLDRKQHQKEFKALRLVALPLKSNGDWKRILPWRRPNCFRGLRTSQVIPTWNFFVLRFRKWNVKKLMAYCKSSKLTIFPCLRIEQNRKKAVFLEWSPFNSPKKAVSLWMDHANTPGMNVQKFIPSFAKSSVFGRIFFLDDLGFFPSLNNQPGGKIRRNPTKERAVSPFPPCTPGPQWSEPALVFTTGTASFEIGMWHYELQQQ